MAAGDGVSFVEVLVVTVVVSGAMIGIGELTRAKGARIFSRGKNGENALVFDPASAPKKAA